MEPYLYLKNVELAKTTLIRCKELGDIVLQNANEKVKICTKIILYRCYYEYYSHDLILNPKKVIQNFVGYCNNVLKFSSFKNNDLLILMYGASDFFINHLAFRQNAYVIGVMKEIIDKHPDEFDKIEQQKVRIAAQELIYTISSLLELKKQELKTAKKFCNFFIPLDAYPDEAVAVDSPMMDRGSHNEPQKIRELYSKAKKMILEIEETIEKLQKEKSWQIPHCFEDKMKTAKEAFGIVTKLYGFGKKK